MQEKCSSLDKSADQAGIAACLNFIKDDLTTDPLTGSTWKCLYEMISSCYLDKDLVRQYHEKLLHETVNEIQSQIVHYDSEQSKNKCYKKQSMVCFSTWQSETKPEDLSAALEVLKGQAKLFGIFMLSQGKNLKE